MVNCLKKGIVPHVIMRNTSLFSKNNGINGTGINLFLHPVYFIRFSMSQMKERAKLKILYADRLKKSQ